MKLNINIFLEQGDADEQAQNPDVGPEAAAGTSGLVPAVVEPQLLQQQRPKRVIKKPTKSPKTAVKKTAGAKKCKAENRFELFPFFPNNIQTR